MVWQCFTALWEFGHALLQTAPIRSASGPEIPAIVIIPNMGLWEWQTLTIKGVVWKESVESRIWIINTDFFLSFNVLILGISLLVKIFTLLNYLSHDFTNEQHIPCSVYKGMNSRLKLDH